MSLVYMDGFDRYATLADLSMKYQISQSQFTTSGGRYGGGALHMCQFGLTSCYFALPTSLAEVWFSFAVNIDDNEYPWQGNLVNFLSNEGEECIILYSQIEMCFTAYRRTGADSATVIGTSSPILLPSGSWHWLDVHFKLSQTNTGLVEIWVDNTRVLNATGIQTGQLGGTSLNGVGWGALNTVVGGQSTINMVIDDVVVVDPNSGTHNTGRTGDSRICTTHPVSDAGPNQGTPLSGSTHYGAVAAVPWNQGSNYNSMVNTSGQEERYGVSALPVHPSSIAGIQVVAITEKTDAGTATAVLGVTSSGVGENGTSQNIVDPFGIITSIFETDPNTSGAWTEASVNAVEPSYTVSTGDDDL